MLRLFILRHAKSSWALPGKTDFERGLNPRGTKDIVKIARSMIENSYFPDQIYASSSNRTKTTIEGIRHNIQKVQPNRIMPVEYLESLYSGSLDTYYNVVKSHLEKSQSLMIVGHNPTCHSLSETLIDSGKREYMQALFHNFPTGALAVIDIKGDKWSEISAKSGYLQDFILPRNL